MHSSAQLAARQVCRGSVTRLPLCLTVQRRCYTEDRSNPATASESTDALSTSVTSHDAPSGTDSGFSAPSGTGYHGRPIIPNYPTTDWTPGSNYYFGPDEEERFFSTCVVDTTLRPIRAIPARFKPAPEMTDEKSSRTDVAEVQPTVATITGITRTYTIDTTIPPLRREEAERWRFDWFPLMKGFAAGRMLADRHQPTLLPLDAMVTYLGDDMLKMDRLYRSKGFYTPSEVAEVLFPHVPTFTVESRHVISALPVSLVRKVERDFKEANLLLALFERYPMLFVFRWGRFSRSLVHLNSSHWFVRQHPSYGKADAVMRRHRYYEGPAIADASFVTLPSGSQVEALTSAITDKDTTRTGDSAGRPKNGAPSRLPKAPRVPFTVRVFQVLVQHLPRFPTPVKTEDEKAEEAMMGKPQTATQVKERYESLNLLDWIRTIPPHELAFVDSQVEKTVLRVVCQYINIFQPLSMVEGDGNIFVKGEVLLANRAKRRAARQQVTRSGTDTATVLSGSSALKGRDDDALGADRWGFEDGQDGSNATAETEEKYSKGDAAALGSGGTSLTSLDKAHQEKRVVSFKRALADDLIGVEETLTADGGAGMDDGNVKDGDGDAVGNALSRDNGSADGDDRMAEVQDDWDSFNDNESDNRGAVNDEAKHSHERSDRGSGRAMATPSSQESRDAPHGNNHNVSSRNKFFNPHDEGGDAIVSAFGIPLEDIYIRRLPPDVAPRSLSDWDETTSPDVELAELAARYLAPPPSLAVSNSFRNFFVTSAHKHEPLAPRLKIWRWVSVDRIYAGYTPEQRQYLRREYHGVVNFLRYHGKLFELSSDLMYVIAHDPQGTLAPIPFMQRAFSFTDRVLLPPDFDDNPDQSVHVVGEKDRILFARVLGEGWVPTCRRHLLLMDPNNPIMQADVLQEEMANLMPNHPVRQPALMRRLPPIMLAAVPYRINFRASKFIEIFVERGTTWLRRRTSLSSSKVEGRSGASGGAAEARPLSVEDAIAEVLQLPIGPEGVTVYALQRLHLSVAAVDTLSNHFGSMGNALQAFPQYFTIQYEDHKGRQRAVVHLRR